MKTAPAEPSLNNSNRLSVTGITGTVSSVGVSVNTKVSASTTVFSLTDTEYSADYESLLRERKEKEEDLVTLLKIRRDGDYTSLKVDDVIMIMFDQEGGISEIMIPSAIAKDKEKTTSK